MHSNTCELSLLSHLDQITRFLTLLPLLQFFTKYLFTGFLFINFTPLQQTLQYMLQVTEFPITACISKHLNECISSSSFLYLSSGFYLQSVVCRMSYSVRILGLHRGHPVLKRQPHLTSIFHHFYRSPKSVDG